MQDPETHYTYSVGRKAFLDAQGKGEDLSEEEKEHIKVIRN